MVKKLSQTLHRIEKFALDLAKITLKIPDFPAFENYAVQLNDGRTIKTNDNPSRGIEIVAILENIKRRDELIKRARDSLSPTNDEFIKKVIEFLNNCRTYLEKKAKCFEEMRV